MMPPIVVDGTAVIRVLIDDAQKSRTPFSRTGPGTPLRTHNFSLDEESMKICLYDCKISNA
jgi:hypothetical protein